MSIDWWFQTNIISSERAIRDCTITVQHASQCDDGYFEWYLIISHSRNIPHVEHIDDVGPSDARVPVDDVPPPPPTDADDQHCL